MKDKLLITGLKQNKYCSIPPIAGENFSRSLPRVKSRGSKNNCASTVLIKIISLSVTLFVFLSQKALAACPVCTIAVGGMMVLLERYGVDNTISGVWIGGFILSTALWAISGLARKNIKFFSMEMLVLLFFYLSLVAPLYWKEIIGVQGKTIWGVDRAILGMLLGGLIFHFTHLNYLKIKTKNGGKPWFPFQRVVMPVTSLAILSLIFYFLTSTKYLWHEVRGYIDTPLFWILIPLALILHILLFRSMNRLSPKPACH